MSALVQSPLFIEAAVTGRKGPCYLSGFRAGLLSMRSGLIPAGSGNQP